MVVRRYNETDVDFEAIDADLAKLAPPKLTLKNVLDRLRGRMLEQRARGVTVAQMHEVLKARGIDWASAALRRFWTRGSCRVGRLRRSRRRSVKEIPGQTRSELAAGEGVRAPGRIAGASA